MSVLTPSEWLKFLVDCQIPNDKLTHCKRHDCDRIFIETNYLEEAEREQGKLQKKDAMMRYVPAPKTVWLSWIGVGLGFLQPEFDSGTRDVSLLTTYSVGHA